MGSSRSFVSTRNSLIASGERGGRGALDRARMTLAAIACAARFAALSALAAASLASCGKPVDDGKLVVYAYDSFVTEWGPGPAAVKGFKARTGIELELVPKGDAGQVLASVIQEGRSPKADVVLGLDQNLLPKAARARVLLPYAAAGLSAIPENLRFEGNLLTPYDYGVFTLIWDSESGVKPPESLADLADQRFEKKLILMDPRTSSPGLGFLAWTLLEFGEGWKDYWASIRRSTLTVASGWDTGYGLFQKHEAPLVVSYTTSPAYHVYAEDEDRYVALAFPKGHPAQIEGAGIVRGSKRQENARKFLDYLLSEEFQGSVALTNWMFPVSPAVKLPDCYSVVPEASVLDSPSAEALEKALDEWPDAASAR